MEVPDTIHIPDPNEPEQVRPVNDLFIQINGKMETITVSAAFDLIAQLSLMLRMNHEHDKH